MFSSTTLIHSSNEKTTTTSTNEFTPTKPSLSVSLAAQLGLTSLTNLNHSETTSFDGNAQGTLDPLYVSPSFELIEEQKSSTLFNPPSPAWMIEKEKWIHPTLSDKEELKLRFKEKLARGSGECLFVLGKLEDGTSLNFTTEEYTLAFQHLTDLATKLNAVATFLCKKTKHHFTAQTLETLSFVSSSTSSSEDTSRSHTETSISSEDSVVTEAYILLRQTLDVEQFMEVRVAVCGNVDSGKSSLLGVLTKNVLDNGRGKARVALFRHPHEIDSGRTSSVGMEIMGFDSKGSQVGVIYNPITEGDQVPLTHINKTPLQTKAMVSKPLDSNLSSSSSVVVNHIEKSKMSWDHIALHSSKVITFFDLAGHEKYMKTTVYGLCGASPDFSILIIGANMGLVGMTKEHLGLSLALNVPVMIVITKIDMCPEPVLHSTVTHLLKILKSKGCRKLPLFIRSMEDVVKVASLFVSERICPIFLVSNVTGEGLPYLRRFLNLLPLMSKYDLYQPSECLITEQFSVPGVGTVVSATVLAGTVHLGDTLYLGPDDHGHFIPTQIKSLQLKCVPVPSISAGHTGTFALKKIKRTMLRKGMVLLSKEAELSSCREFEAEVLVLSHSTTIHPKYQATLHCQTVRQTATVLDISGHSLLRTGDKALVKFRFLTHPERLKIGSRVLFREGRTKCIGTIVRVFPLKKDTGMHSTSSSSSSHSYHHQEKKEPMASCSSITTNNASSMSPMFTMSSKARRELRKKLLASDRLDEPNYYVSSSSVVTG